MRCSKRRWWCTHVHTYIRSEVHSHWCIFYWCTFSFVFASDSISLLVIELLLLLELKSFHCSYCRIVMFVRLHDIRTTTHVSYNNFKCLQLATFNHGFFRPENCTILVTNERYTEWKDKKTITWLWFYVQTQSFSSFNTASLFFHRHVFLFSIFF